MTAKLSNFTFGKTRYKEEKKSHGISSDTLGLLGGKNTYFSLNVLLETMLSLNLAFNV